MDAELEQRFALFERSGQVSPEVARFARGELDRVAQGWGLALEEDSAGMLVSHLLLALERARAGEVIWEWEGQEDTADELAERPWALEEARRIVENARVELGADLPDGEHCYQVTAMDEAGNLSAPSNQICRALDNHPPHVVLIEPPDGLRFDYPLGLLGDTLDTDIATVVFQYRAVGSPDWLDVGPADTQAPWETVLDPVALSFGDYELRAVATDTHGSVDPNPESVTVTYGDATPPGAPQDLVARVDAYDVTLTWTANTEADLDGYNVYRDGELLTPSLHAGTTYVDAGLDLASYRYTVTAVDNDGNESVPASDDAVVYQVTLDQPVELLVVRQDQVRVARDTKP